MASRRVINNTSRDIKRRLEQITKKCSELKNLGVPTALVYSMSKTNGLHIVGDPKITQVIEEHKDAILLNPEWMDEDDDVSYTATAMLPPPPDKLSCLNGITMKSFIIGILKDLNLSCQLKVHTPSFKAP